MKFKLLTMQENYTKSKHDALLPNKKVVNFILDYSKSFRVLKSKNTHFEVFIN